jgi:nucleotide-binding universal stress UspA family protein
MKILLAVDGSKSSDAALGAVIKERRASEDEVRVITVLQPIMISAVPQMAAGYAPELEAERKRAREIVEKAAERLRSAGFRAGVVVGQGDIREKILDEAEDWKAELIVLGSHGRGQVKRLLLGSVAESVARHATCSVEIVKGA